ncbi:class I SAM-dependent methyltransferase [Halobacteriales archaeon QS_8_65_32]|nr:MAG: class I SAM-dependent methyltransferase [Halobacteriales archaeon QS_8_65_32]
MTETDLDGTIDWDAYWTVTDDVSTDTANPSAQHADDVLAALVAETGAESVADVGCGGGAAAFAVAERHPNTAVVGYDAAESVLDANRERAREEGVGNVRFERAILPDFEPGTAFDLVFSYFTLPYVRDVERALRNLHDAVAPGGALVCNYLNENAREYCLEAAENPHAHEDHAFVFDPDSYTERFAALLDGDSVLGDDRISDALGVEPQSAWSVVDRPDTRWAWHHAPLVYVPK